MMKKTLAYLLVLVSLICIASAGVFAEGTTILSDSYNTVKFYDAATNLRIGEFGNLESIFAEVDFIAPTSGFAKVYMAAYDDEGILLKASVSEKIGMTEGETVEYTASAISVSGAETVSVFVWNAGSLKPILAAPAVIGKTGVKEVKFEAGKINPVVDTEYTLGEFFKEKEGIVNEIDSASVKVEASEGVTYTPDSSDWTKGVVKATVPGEITLTIYDNFLCEKTTATFTVVAPVTKFAAKEVTLVTDVATKIGDMFSAVEGVEISNVTVEVTGNASYVAGATWQEGTITATEAGEIVVKIYDDLLCIPTEAAFTVVAPETKFVAKEVTLVTDVATKIGDMFAEIPDLVRPVEDGEVSVSINGKAEYTADKAVWENGTVTATEAGEIEVTITDNNLCIATTATFTVVAPKVKFEAKEVTLVTDVATTVGEMFSAIEGAEISNVTVEVTGNASYTAGATWQEGTITATEAGEITVKIYDDLLCIPTEAAFTVVAPETKFVAKEVTLVTDVATKIGDMFAEIPDLVRPVEDGEVSVSINGKAEYTADKAVWENGTVTATEAGEIEVTITDNNLCIATTATFTVVAPKVKFEAKEVTLVTDIATTIGEMFSAIEGVEISNVTVEVTGNASYVAGTTWQEGTITATEAGEIVVKIYDDALCIPTEAAFTVIASGAEFTSKFKNDYLYKVGNQNAVALGSLFEATSEVQNISVTVESVDKNINVSGVLTNTNNADWTKKEIKFEGTGVVKVTVRDGAADPAELILEVVEAKNVTAPGDATTGNIVLLNDCGLSSITVSGNYTFYGNGFTATYTADGRYLNNGLKQGIVTVKENGTLDNLRIIASIYPTSYMYYREVQNSSYKEVDGDRTRYFYQLSAVSASDNATISNCYVYGSRNNIFVGTGNVTVKDSVLECGTLSNIQIQSNNSHTVTLENVTTIQHQVASTIGEAATMLGAGVIVGPDTTDNPAINLNGYFKQYNWVNGDDKTGVTNGTAQTIIDTALNTTEFNHTINGKTASNLGIIYMNDFGYTVNNNTGLPYQQKAVSLMGQSGQVYSLQGASDEQIYFDYSNADKSTVNGLYKPQFRFAENLGGQYVEKTDGCDEYCYTEGDNVKVMFLSGDAIELNLAGLIDISKYSGQNMNLEITCKDTDGNSLAVTNGKVTLSEAKDYIITYKVTDTVFYDKNGNSTDGNKDYSWDIGLSVSLKDVATPDAYFEFDAAKQKMGYYKPSYGDVKQYLPFLAGLKIYDYDKQTKYLRFDGDNDFSKVAAITITGYSSNKAALEIKLTDGGVINTQFLARANSGGGSTYTGKIKTSGNTIYFVTDSGTSNKDTTTTAAYWYVDYYKFTGNNGVAIQSAQQTFNSTGSSASTPSGSFSTTIKATVNFDANGGSCVQALAYSTSTTTAVKLPSAKRSGYAFVGWYTAQTNGTRVGGAGDSYTPSGNITLYAVWGKPSTVTYNANGGVCSVTTDKFTGDALVLPEATLEGKAHIGWYTAPNGGERIGVSGETYVPTGDITLYAQWANPPTVTYNANGGSCSETSAVYTNKALTLPTPTKSGYVFTGWYTAASGGEKVGDAGTDYTPTADVTLYAQWRGVVVTYNANGGSCSTSSQTYSGTALTLPTPTRSNYTFNGWYTASSGGSKVGNAGASYTPTADITLYARWTKDSCVTGDTLITLADGSKKRIDSVEATDIIRAWDFYEGKYVETTAFYVVNHGYENNTIITLDFEDGTQVKVINNHEFFDADENAFVMITDESAAEYIGHNFVKENGNGYETVKLTGCDVKEEYIEAYSLLSYKYHNCMSNGMFSLTVAEIPTKVFMPFEIGSDMTFDSEMLKADIEKYGLCSYEEYEDIVPREIFEALNLQYINVTIGKGIVTYDEVVYLLDIHFGK